jgi:hypothetical protein
MSPRTRHHIRQPRPDRRFRRLLPAAVATAALATGIPAAAAPASVHPPQRAHVRPAAPQKAVVPRAPRDASGTGAVASG